MTTLDTLQPAPAATWIGQATAVEQARAVAEVAAAVQVAKMFPRDMRRAQADMRRACSRFAMADRAFYNFRRGGQNVNGPTVYLARELGRCFGNLQWGIQELRRDEAGGLSEMQAFAWDVENNSRQSTTFVVPHARDVTVEVNGEKENAIKPLATLRDVYENNANQGARRQREMILGLLPQWFVDEAIDLCRAALRKGEGDTSLDERIAAAVEGFAQAFRVDRARLERRVGAPISAWSEQDVADMRIVFRTLQRGESTVAEQFPTSSVTIEDIVAAPTPAAAAPAAAAAEPAAAQQDEPISRPQWDAINSRFAEMEVKGDGQKAARAGVIRSVLGLPQLDISVMTSQQAQFVLDQLVGEAGVVMVADILTRNGAPAHLIPALPEPEPTTGEGLDGGALPGEVAGDPVPSDDEIDPTTGDDWPGSAADFQDAEGGAE